MESSSTYSDFSLAEEVSIGDIRPTIDVGLARSTGNAHTIFSLPSSIGYLDDAFDLEQSQSTTSGYLGSVLPLTEEALRMRDMMRPKRVEAILVSGEPVGWCIMDLAVEHRFTFRGELKVAEVLDSGMRWCKPAYESVEGNGPWYTLLPDFCPTAILYANGSLATANDELWNGPGPITILMEEPK